MKIDTLFLLGLLAVSSEVVNASNQPNIVFILADDLGFSDLSYMKSDYYETPNIDKLISEGTYFSNAYSGAANSAPSRACLLSGCYAPRHGVFTVSPPDRGDKTKRKFIAIENKEDLAGHFVTIPELLKESGYYCAHIGKWHLGDDDESTGPLSQGFDLNIAGGRPGTPYSYFYPYKNKKNQYHTGLEKGSEGEYLTDRLTSEAIDVIKNRDTKKPFFIYLAQHAVHTPLRAPKHLIDKYKQKQPGVKHSNPVYAAMIENLDYNVGRITHTLDSLGLIDNTMVVFYSDNGGVQGITDNTPLKGGKGMPYEGGIRVPLLIKYPPLFKAGTKSSVPVTAVDFLPTFKALAGGPVIKSEDDGENIISLAKRNRRMKDIFFHFPAYLESAKKDNDGFRAKPYSIIRSDNWKLIYNYETEIAELYDLDKDPGEVVNLANTNKHKTKELMKRLNAWIKDTKAPIPTESNPFYINKQL